MEASFIVVNWLLIDDKRVLIGATDNLRWKFDTEFGMSGKEAKTIIWVTLDGELNSGEAVKEMVEIGCSPNDPNREMALKGIPVLLEIAWEILEKNLNYKTAHKRFFGLEIRI